MILSELGSLDPLQILIAAFVVFVGGFLRGFVGFGSALVIIPVLALIFTPVLAVIMHGIMDLPSIVQLLPKAARHCARKTVLPMILSMLAGIPIGAFLLSVIEAEPMRIVISVLVLIMVGLLALNTRFDFATGTKTIVSGGIVGGLIQGLAGVGGPPIVALLLSRKENPETTRGNIVVMMSSLITSAIIVYWAIGLISARALILGGCAAPIYMSAAYFGSLYFSTGGSGIFRNIALLILALTAISTLVLSFW
ncbi:MAG: sulfite exporter TauE/SafE family protein [Rhodospirillales bacterium]|nr:sulfite exporter TauE/SafE family protein [Rhodospirillales bacterium]